MNSLTRNTPVALVVGAAGFLGSYLVEKLLKKGIQVIGIDDLSGGNEEFLEEASKNQCFHFFRQSGATRNLIGIPRLDYIFISLAEDILPHVYRACLDNVLAAAKNYHSKVVLLSSIDLYDDHKSGLSNLREAERVLAKFALENHANARVVRLAAVYGPRMHFDRDDPMVRLIEAAARGDLQKEPTPLDFTTRAIFVMDAVDLLIKAVMHGATAQKIYDGALLNPVKVSEVKQVLMDPLWYENRGFTPTELPPWPTPNIEKTTRELSWEPATPLVSALKKTIHDLKDNPALVAKVKRRVEKSKLETEAVKVIAPQKAEETKKEKTQRQHKGVKRYLAVTLGVMVITYALIYPILTTLVSVAQIKANFAQAKAAVSRGEFIKAQEKINQAKIEVENLNRMAGLIKPLRRLGFFDDNFQEIDDTLQLLTTATDATSHAVAGAVALSAGWKVITGEEGSLKQSLSTANFELSQAEKGVGVALIRPAPSVWPAGGVGEIKKSLQDSQSMITFTRAVSFLLPLVVPEEGERVYLVVLADNNNLNFAGGENIALVKVTFDKGKLISVIAGQKEEISALVKTNEADFSVNAQNILTTFSQQSKATLAGVVWLDQTTLTSLGTVLGSSDAADPTGQLEQLLNKLFFLSEQSWYNGALVLNKLLEEKHLMIYAGDPTLLSILSSYHFSGVIPRQQVKKGEREEFLGVFGETLKGKSLEIKKEMVLNSKLNDQGQLSHHLIINLKNLGSSNYQSQLKVYLAAGSRLVRGSFGEKDITSEAGSFSDFGRAGYLVTVGLRAGEQKNLSLEYEEVGALELSKDNLKYKLVVVKQPGTIGDKFDFKFNYPQSVKAEAGGGPQAIPQELAFSTDLSQDRTFELTLHK